MRWRRGGDGVALVADGGRWMALVGDGEMVEVLGGAGRWWRYWLARRHDGLAAAAAGGGRGSGKWERDGEARPKGN